MQEGKAARKTGDGRVDYGGPRRGLELARCGTDPPKADNGPRQCPQRNGHER